LVFSVRWPRPLKVAAAARRGALVGALAHLPCWGLAALTQGNLPPSPLEAALTVTTFSFVSSALSLGFVGWVTVPVGAGVGVVFGTWLTPEVDGDEGAA
jgi:hypothetical protein